MTNKLRRVATFGASVCLVITSTAGPVVLASPASAAAKKTDKCSTTTRQADKSKTDPDCPATDVKPVRDVKDPKSADKPAASDQKNSDQKNSDQKNSDQKNSDQKSKNKKKTPEEIAAEKAAKKEAKKKAKEAAEAHQAAVQALAAAEADLPRVTKWYKEVTARQKAAEKKINSMSGEVAAARTLIARVARSAYMAGIEPEMLDQVATLDAATSDDWQDSQQMLRTVGDRQANQVSHAMAVIKQAQADKAAADADFAKGKAEYDLVRLNVAVARFALGEGPNPLADVDASGGLTQYPLPACGFDQSQTINVTRSCTDAMKYALAQVALPEKDWTNLCLNFVTIAYGAPQRIPRAIDQWSGLPPEAHHSPNTVAPAGALMFWAPNHVAISLGNNMIVSTDVLGYGRAWIVPFQTIQARWNLPYLGWTYPDFRNA